MLNFSYYKIKNLYVDFKNQQNYENIESSKTEIIKEEPKAKEYKETQDLWQIEIPKIGLVAPISEGTSQEVMLEFVGHFENTSVFSGNVGLAAHNRGYPINYFEKVKDLEIGDEIIYKYKNKEQKYKVTLSVIIEDTNWSYLQESSENKITLITCVANRPNKRLCVQAIKIEEENNEGKNINNN